MNKIILIKKKSKKRVILKVLLYIVITILSLLLLYIIFNVIFSIIEKNKLKSYEYGIKVDVNGHKMVVDIVGENNEKTIVILTGYAAPSPVILYKPLAETFSKHFKVVTIEPFGYGLSDMVEEERNIEQITTELHTCLQQLKLDKYYFMAHSLGGAYALYYSNKYTNEILGFIGLDNSVPRLEDVYKESIETTRKGVEYIHIFNILGISRMQSFFNKNNLYIPLTSSYNYTDEEKDMYRNIFLHKGANKLVIDEGYSMLNSAIAIHDMKFPKNIRLVQYLCEKSVNSRHFKNQYKPLHDDVGSESLSNDVIVLPGDHINFVFIHREEIFNKVNDTYKDELNNINTNVNNTLNNEIINKTNSTIAA